MLDINLNSKERKEKGKIVNKSQFLTNLGINISCFIELLNFRAGFELSGLSQDHGVGGVYIKLDQDPTPLLKQNQVDCLID